MTLAEKIDGVSIWWKFSHMLLNCFHPALTFGKKTAMYSLSFNAVHYCGR